MEAENGMPSFDEIRSHSSMKTNERVDLVLRTIDAAIDDVWSNLCIPALLSYHAGLWSLYMTFIPILDEPQIKALLDLFIKYRKDMKGAVKDGKVSPNEMESLRDTLDRINIRMRLYPQMKSYYFKMGMAPVKGINAALAIVEKGGGIFGDVPIERVSKLPKDAN